MVHKCEEKATGLKLAAKIIKARGDKEKVGSLFINGPHTVLHLLNRPCPSGSQAIIVIKPADLPLALQLCFSAHQSLLSGFSHIFCFTFLITTFPTFFSDLCVSLAFLLFFFFLSPTFNSISVFFLMVWPVK